MTRHKLALGVATVAAAGAMLAAAGPAQAATPASEAGSSPATIACETIWQYRVIADGDMTDAPTGGNYVGDARFNDLINVRIKGSIRYYGPNNRSGVWGWVLTSKLQYTGNTWCG